MDRHFQLLEGMRLMLAESIVSVDGKAVGRGTGTFMRSAVRLDDAIGYRR